MAASLSNKLLSLVLPLALMMTVFLFGNACVGNSQTPSNASLTLHQGDRIFQSVKDSFTIKVPNGWVMEETYDTDTDALLSEMMQGLRLAAELCPDKDALIDINDGYRCDESNQRVYVQRYPNLSNEPEFSSIFNSGTTSNDALLDYHILKLEELGYNEINTVHNTRTRINVIDIDTNKTTATVPASLLEMRYENTEAVDRRAFMMLLATNATSNPDSITGYILSYEADTIQQPSGIPPQPVSQIFQSFHLLNDAENGDLFLHGQDNGQFENHDAFTGTSLAQLPWNASLPSIATDMGSTNIDSSE